MIKDSLDKHLKRMRLGVLLLVISYTVQLLTEYSATPGMLLVGVIMIEESMMLTFRLLHNIIILLNTNNAALMQLLDRGEKFGNN